MRPHLLPRLLLAGVALLPLSVLADPVAYGVGYRDLYRIDLANGSYSRIGAIGYNDVEGLAFGSFNTLYGAVDGSQGAGGGTTDFLIRIDTQTGAGTLHAPLTALAGAGPNGELDYGLALTCDGRMWLSTESTQELWEIAADGSLSRIGSTGAALSGLAGRERTLYGVSVGSDAALYRIDTTTGTTTRVGPLAIGGAIENVGLDFDSSGTLWATLDPRDSQRPSRVVRIDLDTGRATLVSEINLNVGIKGLAIAPVPACQPTTDPVTGGSRAGPTEVPGPGVPALFALCLAALGLGGRALRRRAR